jgi:rare lipoprotein A
MPVAPVSDTGFYAPSVTLITGFSPVVDFLVNSIQKKTDIYNMKRNCVILFVFWAAAFCVPRYTEAQVPETDIFRQEGIASWYGPEFDGRPTASGEIFNSSYLTAAHPTLPFGTMLVVTNRHNNKQVTVRVNDRGPFVSARIIDVSKAAAEQLDMLITGTAPVMVESVDRIVSSTPARTTAPDQYWTLPPAQPAVTAAEAPPAVAAVPQQPLPQPVPVTPAVPADVPAVTPRPPAPAAVTVQAPPAAPPVRPQPVSAPASSPAELNPVISPAPNKLYRLQIGSFKVARNAVETYEKLKNAGLNPAYERNGEFFRVVLAGIKGVEVQSVAEKLGTAGFREALIREEH